MTEHDDGYDPYNSATTRKAPPIPDWLRNDPDIEAAAFAICSTLPRWQTQSGSWSSGRGAGKSTLARYRK